MLDDRVKLARVRAGNHFVENCERRVINSNARFSILVDDGREHLFLTDAFDESGDARSVQNLDQCRRRSFMSIR